MWHNSGMGKIEAIDITNSNDLESAINSNDLESAIKQYYLEHPEKAKSVDEIVEVGVGIAFQFPKKIRIIDDEIPEIHTEMWVDYDAALGLAVPVSVTVTRNEPGVQISSNVLRKLRMRAYIRKALEASALIVSDGKYVPWSIDQLSDADEEEQPRIFSREMGLTVIRVYRIAEVANDSPAKAVQDTFDLKPATATRWIRKAKTMFPDWRTYKIKR
jgi:hypothetical protein